MTTEKEALRLTTLEHQFCIKCWARGLRVRIISLAERPALGDLAYRAKRRQALAAHLKEAHG